VEATFDSSGYPTEEALDVLAKWDYADPAGAFLYMSTLWNHSMGWFSQKESIIEPLFHDRDAVDDRVWYCCATGGWSGNEDVIAALQQNTVLWLFSWSASVRGGYYEFNFCTSK